MAWAWPGDRSGKDEHAGVVLHGAHEHVLEFAPSDEVARIGLGPPLDRDVHDLDARGSAQLAQFVDPAFALAALLADLGHYQQGALGAPGRPARGQDAVEFFLQGIDDLDEIDGGAMERRGRQQDPRGFSLAWRHQVGHVKIGGAAFVVHAHRGHHVQSKQGEVDEIVAGKCLVAQVGVHEAQAAEAAVARAQTADLGQDQARGIAHDHVLDGALA